MFIGDVTAPTFVDVTGNVTEWTNKNVTLTVNGAEDTETGLHESAYSFNNYEDEFDWQESNSKTFSSNQTVYIYIRDDAGNIEYVDTVIIDKIDKEGPTISKVTRNDENGMTTLTIEATDSQSGVAAYRMNSGNWIEGNSFSFKTDSYNYVCLYVKDKLGNSTLRYYSFYYPRCYKNGDQIYIYNPNPNCSSTIYYRTSKFIFTSWHEYTGSFTTSKSTIYATFIKPSSKLNLNADGEISFDVSKIPTIPSYSYTAGKYEESHCDMEIKYKDVKFDLMRVYDYVSNRWFYSINSNLTYDQYSNRITAVFPDNTKHLFWPSKNNTYYDNNSKYKIKVEKGNNGNIVSYTIDFDGMYYNYNSNGILKSVSNNKGDEITITKNDYGFVITDGFGRKYELLMLNNNMKLIKDPKGGSITYNYNSSNKLVSVVDQSGTFIDTYSYDSNGRVSKSNGVNISYDSSNKVISKTYDNGMYENYTYDGNTITVENSASEISVVTYDYNGNITYKANPNGTSVAYNYDSSKRVSKETLNDGSSITYSYNSDNKLLSKVNSNGDSLYYTYDTNGNRIYEKTTIDSQTKHKYYVYDSDNRVVLYATLKDDYEGVIPTQYDEALNCFNTVEYSYSNGLISSKNDNINDTVTNYEYDDYGYLSKTTEVKTENGKEVTKVINSTYDIMGNLLELSSENVNSKYIYDAAGRILLKNENGRCTRILYDEYGRVIQKIDPEDYDASKDGLPEENTYADSNAGHTYVYDSNGMLKSETNRFGRTTNYSYNEIGNKISEEFDLYKFIYSNSGDLSEIKIDGATIVTYNYDEDNSRLLSKEYANDHAVRYEYDENGNVAAQYHDDDSIPYVEYAYNENNKLIEKINNDTGLRYSYCDSGYVSVYRLLDDTLVQSYQKEETDLGVTINENHFGSYYTSVFNDTSISFQTNNNIINYIFDEDSKIKTAAIENNGEEVLEIAYDYLDNIGSDKQYTYKSDGSTYTTKFCEFYDETGRTILQTIGDIQNNYTYDVNGQLLRVDSKLFEDAYTATYAYDERGNLISKSLYDYTTSSLEDSVPNEVIDFTYSNIDWLDQLVEVNGDELMYDEIGNLIYYGDIEYVWNSNRNLECVIDENTGNEYNYTYDENGVRTSKTIDGETTYFNTKDGVVIAQTDGTNTMYFQYDVNGVPIGFICNDIQYFYLTNLSGDVLGITEAGGNPIVCYLYDEWGKLISIDAKDEESYNIATINPLRYRGYYYDNETGYYCIGSRYYNPEICRFINSDNYEILKSTKDSEPVNNLFTYFNNDPINNTEFISPYFEKKN